MPMRGSFEVEWEDSPRLRELQRFINTEEEWAVVFEAYHAKIIEWGAGPGHEPDAHGRWMPPFNPIFEWVQRKLGIKGAKAKAATEAIRWKIYETGLEPQPFARPAVYDASAHLVELLEQELSLSTVAEYIKSQAQYYIELNGTTDQGTLHRMISVTRVK